MKTLYIISKFSSIFTPEHYGYFFRTIRNVDQFNFDKVVTKELRKPSPFLKKMLENISIETIKFKIVDATYNKRKYERLKIKYSLITLEDQNCYNKFYMDKITFQNIIGKQLSHEEYQNIVNETNLKKSAMLDKLKEKYEHYCDKIMSEYV